MRDFWLIQFIWTRFDNRHGTLGRYYSYVFNFNGTTRELTLETTNNCYSNNYDLNKI